MAYKKHPNPNLKCQSFYGNDASELEDRINEWLELEPPLEIVSCNYSVVKLAPTSENSEHFALVFYKLT